MDTASDKGAAASDELAAASDKASARAALATVPAGERQLATVQTISCVEPIPGHH
jgi:hypothetical protein